MLVNGFGTSLKFISVAGAWDTQHAFSAIVRRGFQGWRR